MCTHVKTSEFVPALICKVILSFLNDDIFEGHFTKSIYLSNSKSRP